MECKILHESKGRIRVSLLGRSMSLADADTLEYYMRDTCGVTDIKVHDRTCCAIIHYVGHKESIIEALAGFSYNDSRALELVPEHTGRQLNRKFEDRLAITIVKRVLVNLFPPNPVRKIITLYKAAGFIWEGIKTLFRGKMEVSVLDATAISAALIRGDFKTASSIMFLLKVGGILEEWTQKKSLDDLARAMSLNVDMVWKKCNGKEELVSIHCISSGDDIVVRTGNMIPLDGKVVGGEATVNQSSITGESLPVIKEEGSYAYAGTVVEEGESIICVDKISGTGRYDRIVAMIEESEKLKSASEDKASHLADKLVPYSLLSTGLVGLATRSVDKAMSILMVDFSCALKMAMPIAVLSAIREGNYYNIAVKGGKFLESMANVDTIVFDKTGTLTCAKPMVAEVVSFNGEDEVEMLRLAACLEEHYPHSMANAVVDEAKRRGLNHEERHSKVQYVVAHGISSEVDGKKVVIGSQHFVFQDEESLINEEEKGKFDDLPANYSHLYMAIDGVLSAVICIADPIREEAAAVVTSLRKLGVDKIVMMTGDNERTAKDVAEKVGVDAYYAEVLPEEKAAFVEKEKQGGRYVVMIGDGINDSPALSAADVGIAISDGAAIAREIADITIAADNLFALVTLKSISDGLMKRIDKNYKFIISFNVALMALGVSGIIRPVTASLFHNLSTVGVSLRSMTNLLV